jgi:intracellular multiplication protein IcmK
MTNKTASSMLILIAFSALATVFSPYALAADELPPGLAQLPQATAPPPPASPPTTTQEAAMPAGSSPTNTNQDFQQWPQGGNNALPSGSVVSSTTTTTTSTVKPDLRAPLTYDQSKEVMLETAPDSSQTVSADTEAAFDSLMQQNMPLTPQQVVKLRQQIDTAQRAAAIPPVIPPKPVSTTLMINLAPGTSPPAIRLAQGYVSSLVFVDSTGTPWPISQFDVGNPKAVNLQWDGKSNIILIQAIAPYSHGDIVVRLVGLPTPITLEIVSGQRVVDYRVDIHVSGIGPNTKELPIGTALPGSANQLLLGVLDGIAPAGSKPLTIKGADAQAWILGQTMYLRTRLTVLSPGWVGKMVSPDGMQAYELPRSSSVLVSRYGEPVELKVEGL